RSPSNCSTQSTRCSSTRGPATEPSLVTWPTRIVATPDSFATRNSRPAASRTWATDPGAEPSSEAYSVWTESITQTSGRSACRVWQTVSNSVSARISTAPAPPSRSARSLTCATASSPVTSSARRSREMVARALSSSVDFPTPGSPPSNTSEPGTSPPPSTRSSSGTPLEIRAASATSTSTSRSSGFGGTWDCETWPTTSSTSVPNAEQPGHLPNQRPAVYPHSVQLNWTATDFATRPPYGRSRTQIVTRSEHHRAETETAPPSGAASVTSREGLGSRRRIGAQPRLCSMRRSSCGGAG